MKYIPLIAFFSITCLVFGAGCLKGDETEDPNISSKPELQKCNEIADEQNRENCYKSVAVQNLDASLCEEIRVHTNIKNLCIQLVAEGTKDPLVCEKIMDDDWRKNICVTHSKN